MKNGTSCSEEREKPGTKNLQALTK